MRIVIDMQGAQTGSRFRGIGQYSLSLVKAMVDVNDGHEIILALNGVLADAVNSIRVAFKDSLPKDSIRLWFPPRLTGKQYLNFDSRRIAMAEKVREAFLASLAPDVILITSLFEYDKNACSSIGVFDQKTPVTTILYDLIPLLHMNEYKTKLAYKTYYDRKLAYLKKSSHIFSISEFSKKEAVDILKIDENKISLAPPSYRSLFKEKSLDCDTQKKLMATKGINRQFILYVGRADERKNLDRLIRAYAGLSIELKGRYQLVFGGQIWPEEVRRLRATASAGGVLENDFIITDYLTPDELLTFYDRCELFVFPSLCEGFGMPPLEAMARGAAVICSNETSLPEVVGLNEAMFNPESIEAIRDKMAQVLTNDEFRGKLKKSGLERSQLFNWAKSAKQVFKNLEATVASTEKHHGRQPTNVESLIASLATNTPGGLKEQDRIDLARSFALSFPFPAKDHSRKVRLFLDISRLVNYDEKTGIHRVAKNILLELYENESCPYDIVPVKFMEVYGDYFEARLYTECLMGRKSSTIDKDFLIDYHEGDIFLGLDYSPFNLDSCVPRLLEMHNCGVKIKFLVYDLLPLFMPENFPIGATKALLIWLAKMLEYDGAICISKAVADDLEKWLRSQNISVRPSFQISWFHLGADIEKSTHPQKKKLPQQNQALLNNISKHPSFLMVSTIEPRKGHAQVLSAFDSLWAENLDLNLVIIGKKGWLVDQLIKRLNSHPQAGQRLFWLEGANDETLNEMYRQCTALISASLGEGFGLPLIEASKYKMPIIARDLPVFREVGGNDLFYFSGEEPDQLAEAIKAWLGLFQKNIHPKTDGLRFLRWNESAEMLLKAL